MRVITSFVLKNTEQRWNSNMAQQPRANVAPSRLECGLRNEVSLWPQESAESLSLSAVLLSIQTLVPPAIEQLNAKQPAACHAQRRALLQCSPLPPGGRNGDWRHPWRATHGCVPPTADHD